MGFGLDLQLFFGLDRLVQAITPAATRHHPASELIDDHRIAIAHDVVDVLGEHLLGLERIADEVGPGIFRVEQIAHPQLLLGLGIALVGEGHVALLLIDFVVALGIDAVFTHFGGALEQGSHLGGAPIFLLGPLDLAGDDQGGAGLIDQDRVHLVDHAEVGRALHHLGDVAGHVVAQVVEAQLAVGGIGDVAGVVGPAGSGRHVLLDQAHREAQEAVHLAHPLGVAPGQVVVHGHHVHAPAGEGVEVGRQGGHQGFALAGFHLGDLAVVQHHAADQLHIEVAHAQHPLARLAYYGKGLGQQLIEQGPLLGRLAGHLLQLLAEFSGEAAQFVVGEGGDLLLEQVDVGNDRLVALQLAGIGITQQELEH